MFLAVFISLFVNMTTENISFSTKLDRWIRKAQLSESKGSVNDVKFAPRHQGLKLASASADGIVRIYEVTDIFSLSYWPIQVARQQALLPFLVF